jgi:type VI secretion system secreted protein Hcp
MNNVLPQTGIAKVKLGYVKVGDFEGEATDSNHQGWSILSQLSAAITRTTGGFQSRERPTGATALVDAVVIKDLDSASVKIQKACATGQLVPKVQIELCTMVGNSAEPYLSYELENVIVTGYDLINLDDPLRIQPLERVALSYTKVTWTYTKYDTTGKSQGKVSDSYTIGAKS